MYVQKCDLTCLLSSRHARLLDADSLALPPSKTRIHLPITVRFPSLETVLFAFVPFKKQQFTSDGNQTPVSRLCLFVRS